MERRNFLSASVAVLLSSVSAMAIAPPYAAAAEPAKAASAPASTDWREEYAYALGVQAYVFGLPWIQLPPLRWAWVTQAQNPELIPYAPLNQFWNSRELATASYRGGGAPNNDSMYSIAWLNLKAEPVILSVPDVGDRYYTMEMASMDCDNHAYVGKRTTGTKAGNYAIVGPDWKGTLPADVKPLPPARTNSVWILGRTLVYGPEDIPNVRAIQAQYRLTPLHLWGKPGAPLPVSRDVFQPFDPKGDPLAHWKTMNRAMTEDPPIAQHQVLVKMFATIGVGPGMDVDRQDEATKRGLVRAAQDARKMMHETWMSGGIGKQVNGWRYPPMTAGRAGLHDDFLTRGVICMSGNLINDPPEAIYINTALDSDGQKLSGVNRYVLRFPPGGLPKVDAFWSLTMYGEDYNLVANPIDRYKLGTYPKGSMRPDPDGGLTIHIQKDSPGRDKESNWLPAPAGEFYLLLRTYLPSPQLLDGTWVPPALERVG